MHDCLTQKVEIGTRPGPDPVIGKDLEAELVKWVIEMSEIGYGQTDSDFQQFLLKNDLFDHPSWIWSGFSLCPKSSKIVASEGVRHVYQITSSSKLQIPTLVCVSATGAIIAPCTSSQERGSPTIYLQV